MNNKSSVQKMSEESLTGCHVYFICSLSNLKVSCDPINIFLFARRAPFEHAQQTGRHRFNHTSLCVGLKEICVLQVFISQGWIYGKSSPPEEEK